MTRLIIRADGSHEMGLGHIMRSIAYAEAARDRGLHVWFEVGGDPVGAQLLGRRGFEAHAVPGSDHGGWLSRLLRGDTVLVDGYHFEPKLLSAVAKAGVRLVMMDDIPGIEFADVVIATESRGGLKNRTKPGAELLCGIAYAPIRSEFRELRRHRGYRRDAPGSLAITLGGADAAELTNEVVQAARNAARERFESLEVILGPASAAQVEPSDQPPRISVHRDPPAIAEIFDQTTAVISAAGTTAWELACMGLPAALIEASADQAVVGPEMEQAGAAIALGPVPDAFAAIAEAVRMLADGDVRARISRAALRYVDGMGAVRTLDALFGASSSATGHA